MSSYFKPSSKNYIKVGEKFVVKIAGWDCTSQGPDPLAKRQGVSPRSDLPGAITISKESLYHSWDPQNPNSKMLVMPLGDLSPGSYSIDLNMTGNVETSLVDYQGMTYSIDSSGGKAAFKLADDVPAMSFIGITEDDSVEVSYKLNGESGSPSGSVASRPEAIMSGYVVMGMFMLAVVL